VSSGGDIWREWGRMGGRLLTIWSSSDVDLQSDHTSSSSSTAQTASASKGESLVGIQNSDSAELGFCRPSSASASSKTRSSSKKSKSKGNDHTMHSLGVATIHPDDTAHNRGVQATRGGASAQELAHLEAAFASNGVDQAGGFIAVIRYVPTFPPSRNLVLTMNNSGSGWPHVTPGGDQNHHWTLMILDSTGDVINWDISFPSFRRGMRNQRIIHIASLQGQPDGAFFTPTGRTAPMGAQDWRRIERTTFIYRNPWNTPQDVVYLRGIWTKYGQLAARHQLAP
jgi:hypothetical protein